MVARILSGKSIRGLLNYNESKVVSGDASLILANKFGIDIHEIEMRDKLKRFEHLTRLNGRAKTNAIHIILNFHRSDKPSIEQLQEISVEYMEKIGFGDQPFLAYKHNDVGHPHVHIVTTNIQQNGDRIIIHNLGKTLSEVARKEIEIKYGLVRAEGRELRQNNKGHTHQIKAADYGKRQTKKSIYNVVNPILRSYSFTSLPEFNAALACFNVLADGGKDGTKMYERRGLVYSIIDANGKRIGTPIKSSELPGRPTLKVIEQKFGRNVHDRKIKKKSTTDMIDKIFREPSVKSKKAFVAKLVENGITVFFRQSQQGQIYGVTFVDHNIRTVYNGSELGKSYGAKALLQRIEVAGNRKDVNVSKSPLPSRPENFSQIGQRTKSSGKNEFQNPLDILMERQQMEPSVNTKVKGKKKKKKNLTANNLGI